jgi:hypothetical protein
MGNRRMPQQNRQTTMKQVTTLLILVFLLTLNSCNGQDTKEFFKISDFKFQSIFGTTSKEPKSIYCLLGTGFFRTPRSDNSDSLITEWIKTHPNAKIVSVSSFETIDPNSKMIYCWAIDSKDTLNNYLIKNGCFPGGTMMRPKTWNEMGKREKELYEDTDEKPDVKVHVDKITYDTFIEQIKVAELYARENKLGIWLKDIEE